jgi:hypothetical protein
MKGTEEFSCRKYHLIRFCFLVKGAVLRGDGWALAKGNQS